MVPHRAPLFTPGGHHARRRRQFRLSGHRPRDRTRGGSRGADRTPAGGDRARRHLGPVLVRHRRAPPQGVLRLRAAGDSRGRGRAHVADPAGQRGHGAQRRRPGPGLPAVRHARPDLQGPHRPGRRARLVHRGLPVVRTGPRRLRHAVRREARPAAEDPGLGARHLVRSAPTGAHRAGRLPAAGAEPAADLGRGGRHTRSRSSGPACSGCR